MSPQILGPVRPIALVGMLLVSTAGVGLNTQAAATAECLTAPKAHTPNGSHWYYHTDRATKRKCWFLRDPSEQQQAATTGTSTKPAVSRVATAGAKSTSASSCLAAPNHAAPKGGHWYYHLDRANNRKCWYLRGPSEAAEAPTAAPKVDAVPAAPATHSAQPAAWPAPAKPDADSVWSAAPVKPQSAMVNRGADDGQQSSTDGTGPAQAETPAPATFHEPVASAGASLDGDGQANAAPAADREPQDRPIVADVSKAIAPALPMHGARAEVDPSPNDRRASGAAKSAAPANGAMARAANADQGENISSTMSNSTSTPLGMLLIVALVLALTGILYRVAVKVLAMRGPRVIVDRSGYDWGEHRYDEASTVPKPASEELAPSLVPAVAKLNAPHPIGGRDGWPRDGRGSRLVSASHNGRHEERLTELMRDLDQLLRSRNGK